MKTSSFLFLVFISLSASADTLRIGIFSLQCRFEDDEISDIARYVVTNDVQAYTAATTSFTPPFHETNGVVSVREETTPHTTLYYPNIFAKGIQFHIENGQTNCIITRILTDTAKALEGELPTLTNLAHGAQLFIDSIMSGAITNKTLSELRLLTRVYENGMVRVANQNDGPDDVVLQNFIDIKNNAVFYPLSILDASYNYVGTNRIFILRARYDTPNEPSYKREISVFPLVYADGYWSLCFP